MDRRCNESVRNKTELRWLLKMNVQSHISYIWKNHLLSGSIEQIAITMWLFVKSLYIYWKRHIGFFFILKWYVSNRGLYVNEIHLHFGVSPSYFRTCQISGSRCRLRTGRPMKILKNVMPFFKMFQNVHVYYQTAIILTFTPSILISDNFDANVPSDQNKIEISLSIHSNPYSGSLE